MAQPLKDPEFRTFLRYSVFWYFAVFTGAPFMALFMIQHLGMDARTVQLVGACGSLGIVIISRLWGLLCDTYGYRPVLRILTVVKSATPLFFLFTPQILSVSIPLMAFLMIVDGMMNSGMNLSLTGILLKSTPKKNRAMYIAASNCMAIGLSASIAPILAGKLIDYLNNFPPLDIGIYHFNGYHAIFALSALLRFCALPLANRIHQKTDVPIKTVIKEINFRNAFHVTRLVYSLHDSEKDSERLHAANRLGVLRSPLAISDLISALDDSSQQVREAAADALGGRSGPQRLRGLSPGRSSIPSLVLLLVRPVLLGASATSTRSRPF